MYNIFITTLGYQSEIFQMKKYADGNDPASKVCYALSQAEAGAKYVLAENNIDEIYVVGVPHCNNGNSDLQGTSLRDYDFPSYDNKEEHTEYESFCYRMAQYVKGINIEWNDVLEMTGRKGDEYSTAREERMHILESNCEVKAYFFPTQNDDDGNLPLQNVLKIISLGAQNYKKQEEINLFLHFEGLERTDAFVLLNVMFSREIEEGITLKEIISVKQNQEETGACLIRNDIGRCDIQKLFSGMQAFTSYGKVRLIKEYWQSRGVKDKKLSILIDAMQYIDDGISLSNLKDFYEGLSVLRDVVNEFGEDEQYEDEASLVFSVMLSQIKRDYGTLLEGNTVDNLELIKWTFRKQFIQQTLTIIESRIPEDLVLKGIYFYAYGKEDMPRYKRHLYKAYKDLDARNRYIFNDLNHYWICYVNRGESACKPSKLQNYSAMRVKMLANDKEENPCAYTLLEDHEMLRELLYQYYLVAELRDHLNHAADSLGVWEDEEETEVLENKNMKVVTDAVSRFIELYSRACEAVKDKKYTPYILKKDEFKDYAAKFVKKSGGTKIGKFTTEKLRNDPFGLDGTVEFIQQKGEIVIRIGKLEEIE